MKIIKLIFVVCAFSCESKWSDQVSGTHNENSDFQEMKFPLSSIVVDSVKSWNLNSVLINDYIFSPIDSNKIWLFTKSSVPFELDLFSSSWSTLDKRFGTYALGLSKNNFYLDEVDVEILWIANYKEGLLSYNRYTHEKKEYKALNRIYSMKFTDENILIGSQNGLQLLNRDSNSISTIAELQNKPILEIEINDRIELRNACFQYNYALAFDSLLSVDTADCQAYRYRNINQPNCDYKLHYLSGEANGWREELNIQKGQFELNIRYGINYIQNILYDDTVVWIPSRNRNLEIKAYSVISNKKESLRSNYKFYYHSAINDDSVIWFQDNFSIVYFDKLKRIFFQTPIRSTPRNLQVDSNNLYFNSSDGFQIYAKSYIFDQSRNIEELNDLKIDFDRLVRKLNETTDFKIAYNLYDSAVRRFSPYNHQSIIEGFEQLARSLVYRIPSLEEAETLEEEFFDSIAYENIKVACYFRIIEMANHSGKLNISLKYDSILVEDFPLSRNEHHKKRIERVHSAYLKLGEIDKSNMSEDERLWRQGKTYANLFYYVGPVTEASTYDLGFPFQFLEKLITKYPESEFADDAEITMLRHIEGSSHEGGNNSYNLDAIKKLEEMLEKYPSTNYKAEIFDDMGRLYYDINELEIAKSYCIKVISEFPNYLYSENTKQRLVQIENALRTDKTKSR